MVVARFQLKNCSKPQEVLLIFILLDEKGHEAEWKQMIAMADKDGDGEIDYNEFIEMMSKNNNLE